MSTQPEFWLRGPVEGVPPLLQPVAHALLQAGAEARALMQGFPEELLWRRPGGAASAGFHLQHITGVVDRLFTYARGEPLSDEQREVLAAELDGREERLDSNALLDAFDARVERALQELRSTRESDLTRALGVGRQQLPSTVLGLLFHAAEHVQRHVGQLSVTVRVQTAAADGDADEG
jgi:uncharacterized damage-inducible protein DinB